MYNEKEYLIEEIHKLSKDDLKKITAFIHDLQLKPQRGIKKYSSNELSQIHDAVWVDFD